MYLHMCENVIVKIFCCNGNNRINNEVRIKNIPRLNISILKMCTMLVLISSIIKNFPLIAHTSLQTYM